MAYADYRAEIASILDERKHPLWWVESEISNGNITLRENETAIIGVQAIRHPGGLVEVHGMFAAGEREGILNLIDEVCDQAREAGCDVATISSRPAWARILKSRGFEMSQQTISKELS